MAKELRIEFNGNAGTYLQSRVYERNSSPGNNKKLLASDYEYAADGIDTPFGMGGSLDFLNIKGIGGTARASTWGIGIDSSAAWPNSGFWPMWGGFPSWNSPAIDGKEQLSFALDQTQLSGLSPALGKQSIVTATFSLTSVSGRGQVVAYLYNEGEQVGQEIFSVTRAGQITIQSEGRVFDEVRLGSYSGNVSFYVGQATFDTVGKPFLSIAADEVSKIEGDGETIFTFTVTRSGDTSVETTVDWVAAGYGKSPADASDFVGNVFPTGTVIFAAGVTSQTITVKVNGDVAIEPDEAFTVTLQNPSGDAEIKTAVAQAIIENDDGPARLSIAVTNARKIDSSDLVEFTFTVLRSGNINRKITVPFEVSGGEPEINVDGVTIGDRSFQFEVGEAKKIITLRTSALNSAKINVSLNEVQDGEAFIDLYEGNAEVEIAGGGTWKQYTATADVVTDSSSGSISDRVYSLGGGNDTLSVASTSRSISISADGNTVYGGEGDDTLSVTASNPASTSFATAAASSNTLYGGEGNDNLRVAATSGSYSAEALSNVLYGGAGNDTLSVAVSTSVSNATATAASNALYGGAGDDTLSITVSTSTSASNASAFVYSNTLYGGEGDDILSVTVTAASGSNASATASSNALYGGEGDDTITVSAFSGSGRAYVYGNTVNGGAGKDTFSFIGRSVDVTAAENANVISDFKAEEGDKIVLSVAGGAGNFTQAGTVFNDYTAALNAANGAVSGNTKYYFAKVGGDGFLFYDLDGNAGADHAIKLTGVTTFSADSIIDAV